MRGEPQTPAQEGGGDTSTVATPTPAEDMVVTVELPSGSRVTCPQRLAVLLLPPATVPKRGRQPRD